MPSGGFAQRDQVGRTRNPRDPVNAPPPGPHAVAAPIVVAATAAPATPATGTLATIIELSKPRITRLVALTSGVGFVVAAASSAVAQGGSVSALRSMLSPALALAALGCLVGTVLAAGGANALNQWWERARDAKMPRTCGRPLPTGRLTDRTALTAGLAMSVAGTLTLVLLSGPAAAFVAFATIAIYVLLYTPSKPLTPINTLIGAVPGALPPLIGWAAAITALAPVGTPWHAGLIGPMAWGGWTLFALMFVWQLPHFLAIAWMYKDDYAAGGHKMLPWYDPTGRWTGVTIATTGLTLVPATLLPWRALGAATDTPVLGTPYLVVATLSGLAFAFLCVRLLARALHRPQASTTATPTPTLPRDAARAVFLASIAHLPLILLAMVAEVFLRAIL
jgi:protoheme IX farnesyltransferase